jgi:2-(1,2-epoxy-1,2-dihydrophenyl)acetyl-CoA isomerase
MNYESVLLEREKGVTRISLNRPEKLNGMDLEMADELISAIGEAAEDPKTKVVVITGKGRAFCAGGDLSSSMYAVKDPQELERIVLKFGQVAMTLRNMPKPVLAMVNGAAVGGGFGLALAADIRIASENARLGHAYLNIGVQSDTGSIYFLSHLIGVAKAAELIFTGKIVDAEEAEKIGLVNHLVSPERLEAETTEMAVKLANGPALAMMLAKKLLYQSLTLNIAEAIELEARGHVLTMLSEDMSEGIAAFKEKRVPRFPSAMGKISV